MGLTSFSFFLTLFANRKNDPKEPKADDKAKGGKGKKDAKGGEEKKGGKKGGK